MCDSSTELDTDSDSPARRRFCTRGGCRGNGDVPGVCNRSFGDKSSDNLEQRLRSIWGDLPFGRLTYSGISIATSMADLTTVGRLRYDLFVERDGKSYAQADHRHRTLVEDVDRVSLNFQATAYQRCLASVRLTRAEDAYLDSQLSLIVRDNNLIDPPYVGCLLLSRMIVRVEMRARLCIPDLFRQTYRIGLRSGASLAFLATREPLVPLFGRFGFIETGRKFLDPIAGPLIILALHLRDETRLREVRSPLLDDFMCEAKASSGQAAMQGFLSV
ncbi:hypothetical protein CHELA20_40292 [Hyphomicrobiales bacterium]|nr:hypothetical protein CHELA20_40292 [Hyphomicrobiales bacterium]CAH1688060.1 hypothetical protein CHELA41_40149 [Hyphomicrobiales bacterium]